MTSLRFFWRLLCGTPSTTSWRTALSHGRRPGVLQRLLDGAVDADRRSASPASFSTSRRRGRRSSTRSRTPSDRRRTDALEKILNGADGAGNGVVATIVGVVLLLFGASGVFAELQDALNNIWKVKPKPGLGVRELIKDRLLSFTVVLGTGFLLLVSLVLSAGAGGPGRLDGAHLPGSAWVWHSLNSVAVAGRGGAAVRHDLQDPAGRQDRLARRVDGGGGDGGAVHDRQGVHRRLPRPQRPGRDLRGGRLHRRAADVGLLFGADPAVRRRVHARLRRSHEATRGADGPRDRPTRRARVASRRDGSNALGADATRLASGRPTRLPRRRRDPPPSPSI